MVAVNTYMVCFVKARTLTEPDPAKPTSRIEALKPGVIILRLLACVLCFSFVLRPAFRHIAFVFKGLVVILPTPP